MNRNLKNSHSDNWETPKWLKEHFKHHYDPCPKNPTIDGLKSNWENPTFLNPPYSRPIKWIKKAIEQSKKGISIVMLLRCDPSTKWYKLLMEYGCHVAFFNERLKFSDCKKSPNFASMLIYLNNKKEILGE